MTMTIEQINNAMKEVMVNAKALEETNEVEYVRDTCFCTKTSVCEYCQA